MASSRGAWGIDIGQAGLKAIQLKYSSDTEKATAVAFDYVPHPKILSQPDALPEELIPQAIETFLSRNDIKGQSVAISVPGQTALARFIQLPPVEQSKIAEIIKYEAKQQIPFALEDVIWDYQTLGGGTEANGYMLEAEVGLFAMKRDQVLQHLRPFQNAKVEVDLIQIAPLAVYNFLAFDRLGITPSDDSGGSDEYTIVLDMGADNTTLLVSNGAKIWIRNVPIGGNHFTRALTKEMKLTFAKAEHLKCNATKSPDPRAVFQALRPVFNDYVSEIQRSIGYFSSVNRDAKISKVLGCGNGFKLAGLQKFLQQNLQYEVERVESFDALSGDAVLNAPLFQENVLTFAVPYGLAVQALQLGRVRTSLLPPEIAMARKIRSKKPWAAVAAATLLFGFTMSAAGFHRVYNAVSPERWKPTEDLVTGVSQQAQKFKADYGAAEGEYTSIRQRGDQFTDVSKTQNYWLELHQAINACLPRPVGDEKEEQDVTKQERISLRSVSTVKVKNLANWWTEVSNPEKNPYFEKETAGAAPSGEGYIVKLQCIHHHDGGTIETRDLGYIQSTILQKLQEWKVDVDGKLVPVGQIGISNPIVRTLVPQQITFPPQGFGPAVPRVPGGGGAFGRGRAEAAPQTPGAPVTPDVQILQDQPNEAPATKLIWENMFDIEFVWKPTLNRPDERPAAAAAPATAGGGGGDEEG